jgi:hypothetical protein
MADRVALREAWEELWASILSEGEAVFARTDLSDAEVAAGLQHKLRVAVTALQWRTEFTDTGFPVFWRHLDDRLPTGMPNVDVEYLRAHVHGDKIYRLHGEGGNRDFCIYAAAGDFSELTREMYIGDRWRKDLTPDADGHFELVVGGPPQPGNWLPLRDGTACWVGIRQYFFSWSDTDLPGTFSLQQIDGPDRPAPLDVALMHARLSDATRWFRKQCEVRAKSVSPKVLDISNAVVAPIANGSGTEKVAYGMSSFDLTPDEALVVELDVPEEGTWSVSLCNVWGDSLDFQNRQTSLNGHLAHVDADGRVRLVISSVDPGHPNWLDTAGNLRGIIGYRLLDCSRQLAEPKSEIVPAARLAEALPSDTPQPGADGRRAALLTRRLHFARRYQR